MIFGRESELAALDAAGVQMLAGRGSVVFLAGEAGLGKTTLVHEWWSGARASSPQSLRANPEVRAGTPALLLESACSIPIGNVDVGRLEALQPWIDVIAQLDSQPGVGGRADKSRRKLDLKKLIGDCAPAWAMALPIVGEIAHAATETYRLVKEQQRGIDDFNPSAQNQQQVFQQYVNLVVAVSAEVPLVIFLDDLHWADTSSCNLLFYLARQIVNRRILVIASYRPDDAAQAGEGRGHAVLQIKNEILRYEAGSEIVLGSLSPEAVHGLLVESFPSLRETPSTLQFELWLRNISSGNALFVTQFVKTLREDGLLTEHGEFVGSYDAVRVPPTALAVVEERTRRLDPATRELLMYATAEGEEFTAYVLERLTERKPMELLQELHRAASLGLIVQRGTARVFANQLTGIFGFSHALFHRALYGALLDMQKALLHRQCFELLGAEWERLTAAHGRATTVGMKFLTHAEKCEEWSTAAAVALVLARDARMNFANDEAIAMCERCLGYAARTGDAIMRAEGEYLLGKIHGQRDRFDDAIAAFGRARELFAQLAVTDREIDAMNGQAEALWRQNRYDETIALSTASLERARQAGYGRGEACALSTIGNVHQYEGDTETSLQYQEQSRAMYVALGDRRGEAHALGNIGNAHWALGDYAAALPCLERSLALCEEVGDRQTEANALASIGNVYQCQRDYTTALKHLERSLVLCTAMGARALEARVLQAIGWLQHVVGDEEASLGYLERSLAVNLAIGRKRGEAYVLGNIGCVRRTQGDLAGAEESLERGLKLAREVRDRNAEAHTLCELGKLSEARSSRLTGDARLASLQEAADRLQQGVAIFEELKQAADIADRTEDLRNVRDLLASATGT